MGNMINDHFIVMYKANHQALTVTGIFLDTEKPFAYLTMDVKRNRYINSMAV